MTFDYRHSAPFGTSGAASDGWGILMRTDDASSIDEHIDNANAQDFLIARPIPLPTEVGESPEFISTTPSNKIRSFWGSQLKRAANYVDLTSGAQGVWAALRLQKLSLQQ